MDYTSYTLGTLLSFADETIKRNAMSILKRLQSNAAAQEEARAECVHCGLMRGTWAVHPSCITGHTHETKNSQ